MFGNLRPVLMCLLILFSATSAFAEESLGDKNVSDVREKFMGVHLGLSYIDSGVGAGFNLGVEKGYYLQECVGVSGMFDYATHDTNQSQFFFGVAVLGRNPKWDRNLNASLILAISRFEAGGSGAITAIAIGPRIGYDYKLPFPKPLTASGEFRFLTALHDNVALHVNFLVGLKYWY